MGVWRNIGNDSLSVCIAGKSYNVPPNERMEIDSAYDYAVTGWVREGIQFEQVDEAELEMERVYGNRWNMIAHALDTTLEELAASNPSDAEEILSSPPKPQPTPIKSNRKRNAKQRPKD